MQRTPDSRRCTRSRAGLRAALGDAPRGMLRAGLLGCAMLRRCRRDGLQMRQGWAGVSPCPLQACCAAMRALPVARGSDPGAPHPPTLTALRPLALLPTGNHGHVENDESWHPTTKSQVDQMVRMWPRAYGIGLAGGEREGPPRLA